MEKDLLITEVLRAISAMRTDGLALVFCGGTCLSKAHGIIERMSEDIDFKVVVPEGLSRSARGKRLSAFKKDLADQLSQLGFLAPADEIIARDENSYISLNLHYQSQFPLVASLRPEIKVELNARSPMLPTQSLPVRTILDAFVKPDAPGVGISCLGLRETLAEKVLSFLRRTAEVRAGRNRADYDDRLVRHLYDVSAIARRLSAADNPPGVAFRAMVMADAAQYRNQYPEFEQDPAGEMRGALLALQTEPGFEQDYAKFVEELVFGEPVAYAEVKATFIRLAQRLLAHCD